MTRECSSIHEGVLAVPWTEPPILSVVSSPQRDDKRWIRQHMTTTRVPIAAGSRSHIKALRAPDPARIVACTRSYTQSPTLPLTTAFAISPKPIVA
jgi:hypothetical protein